MQYLWVLKNILIIQIAREFFQSMNYSQFFSFPQMSVLYSDNIPKGKMWVYLDVM